MNTEIATALIIATSLVAASALGLTDALGAHPFWAVKSGAFGSAVGLLIYAGLRWAGLRPRSIALLGGLALLLAGFAAMHGKSLFVASFAENALAGQFWYFGWFTLMAALCITLCALAARALRR